MGKRRPRLKPTLWDGVLAACVGLLACAILFNARVGGAAEYVTAVVYADGVEIDRARIDTPAERTYAANGCTLHARFCPDGVPGARVVSADCPTQDCVHTGTVTHSGEAIVCLPARIVIRLEGGAVPDDAPDAVIG
ncbi:MAG: NusG domain II-containing protein [Oscillibacter sp.]|nr:NusG domain II-containing protein [Oscillibacter sp.]